MNVESILESLGIQIKRYDLDQYLESNLMMLRLEDNTSNRLKKVEVFGNKFEAELYIPDRYNDFLIAKFIRVKNKFIVSIRISKETIMAVEPNLNRMIELSNSSFTYQTERHQYMFWFNSYEEMERNLDEFYWPYVFEEVS